MKMKKGKNNQESKFYLGLLVAFVVTLGVISGIHRLAKGNEFKPTKVIKNEQELLDAIEQSNGNRLVFDKSIPVNNLNKHIVTPVPAIKEGTFEKMENGDFKSNLNEYFITFQVIKTDDNGVPVGMYSNVNVYVDGKVSGVSKYEEDSPSNSKYTFKDKYVEKVKWDLTFKYPEKFVKDFVNNFNNDKANKENNIVMSYQLNIGVNENKDEKIIK